MKKKLRRPGDIGVQGPYGIGGGQLSAGLTIKQLERYRAWIERAIAWRKQEGKK